MERDTRAGVGPGELGALIRRWRDRPGVSFGVGVPGALAEFHPMPGESTTWDDGADVAVGRCSGGAIRIVLADGVLPLPYDLPGRRADRRVRGALFCLPAGRAAVAGRRALREVGARDGLALFDIGVGASTLDAMVAVGDASLARTLRAAEGDRLVGSRHPALKALVEAGPPRLFRSALAEILAVQPIGRTATPEGPHTHLLPDLLDGSAHDRRIVVPDGMASCLAMHVSGDDPLWPALADRFGVARTAGDGRGAPP